MGARMVWLLYYEDRTELEIAQECGQTDRNVRRRLHGYVNRRGERIPGAYNYLKDIMNVLSTATAADLSFETLHLFTRSWRPELNPYPQCFTKSLLGLLHAATEVNCLPQAVRFLERVMQHAPTLFSTLWDCLWKAYQRQYPTFPTAVFLILEAAFHNACLEKFLAFFRPLVETTDAQHYADAVASLHSLYEQQRLEEFFSRMPRLRTEACFLSCCLSLLRPGRDMVE
jgi:hypothetical protein